MKNINYKKILPLFFSVVFLTILFSSPVLSSGEFYEPIRFSSGNDSLISLDLNRDGNLDLISTDDSSRNGFSILLGNGDGTFANEIFYPTDNYTDVILGDDINNDNILDLIVSTYISNYPNIDRYLTTYLGNGDGTFAEVETYELSKKLVSDFTTGYFNEDSFIDIIISNNILLGNGDGTFDEAYIYTTIDLNGPYFVKSFDFNKDDNLDLVVINGERDRKSVV